MTPSEAVRVLENVAHVERDMIRSLGEYVFYRAGYGTVTLDGLFTAQQLIAIAVCMQHIDDGLLFAIRRGNVIEIPPAAGPNHRHPFLSPQQ